MLLLCNAPAAAHYIGVLVCALLFGLFTMCMVCEQVTSIATGQTGVCARVVRRLCMQFRVPDALLHALCVKTV